MDTRLSRILLVEDEPDIRVIATRSLEILGGYQIKPCINGIDAIEKAKKFAPELILMDVLMPEKDGPSTMIELRQISNLKSIPVIFMTARAQRQDIEQYLKIGAIGVIPKPFDPMTLHEQVQCVLNTSNYKGHTQNTDTVHKTPRKPGI